MECTLIRLSQAMRANGGSRYVRFEKEASEAGRLAGDFVTVRTEKRGDKIIIVIEKEDEKK